MKRIILELLVVFCLAHDVTGFAFEYCDAGTIVGNCSTISNAGCLGAESVNSVLIQNGYLDYGPFWYGCPYKNNTCPQGFSYYGWSKFRQYPTPCNAFGVLVSTEVINIHLLGNGHLATYAWLPNGSEYYAESPEPVLLDFWTPIMVQFKYHDNNDTWMLLVVVQNQLFAGAISERVRTYTPPSKNLLFGGNGMKNESNSLMVHLDRTILDPVPRDWDYMYGFLLDIPLRKSYCQNKNGVKTKDLTCYWVEAGPLNWTDAYKNCKTLGFALGYPYGRLAQFPSWNESVWTNLTSKLVTYGNGSVSGKNFWIGGGHQLKWLDINMTEIGVDVVVPSGITSNTSASTSTSCLYVNTKTAPWEWAESMCSLINPYICEMSFDCFLENPCKNQGACQPINDGYNICKCWNGTYGQFCEHGTIQVNCVNNCPCPNPFGFLKHATNGSCSADCISQLQVILKNVSILELQLKQELVEMGIYLNEIESWNCFVLSQYEQMTKQISSNHSNVFESSNCAAVGDLLGKIMLISRYIRRDIKRIESKEKAILPVDLLEQWNNVQEKQQMMMMLPCVIKYLQSASNETISLAVRAFVGDQEKIDVGWSVGYQIENTAGPGGWFIPTKIGDGSCRI